MAIQYELSNELMGSIKTIEFKFGQLDWSQMFPQSSDAQRKSVNQKVGRIEVWYNTVIYRMEFFNDRGQEIASFGPKYSYLKSKTF